MLSTTVRWAKSRWWRCLLYPLNSHLFPSYKAFVYFMQGIIITYSRDSGDSSDSKNITFFARTAGTILNTRLCVRGPRESFRKSTVTTVTTVHCIIKLSKNLSAKIQHFSSNSKLFLNYFCTESVTACIELVVPVDIESTDSLTPVKWFFDSSQTMLWLKSTNGLHGIQHRFPNESHRVSSVVLPILRID